MDGKVVMVTGAAQGFGLGIATISEVGDGTKVLDTYFPFPNRDENVGFVALVLDVLGAEPKSGTTVLSREALEHANQLVDVVLEDGGDHPNARLLPMLLDSLDAPAPLAPARRVPVLTVIADLDDAPIDAHDVYLRLHLISTRKVRPHGCNLDGQFGLLNNVVWTDAGPFDPDGFETTRRRGSAAHDELFVGDDYIHMFKRREIYRHLSNAADRMANCANTLHDIVVKMC